MTVQRFIRKTPSASLRSYFEQAAPATAARIDWAANQAAINRSAIRIVDEADDATSARLRRDAERINGMADEAGQTALYNVVPDRSALDQLANGHDRALWLFLNAPDLFQQAEEVRFTDEKRRGRNWDGFVGQPALVLRRDDAAMDAFKAALRRCFVSQHVHVDAFERTRRSLDGTRSELVQLAIYREGLPDQQFAFEDGALVQRPHRPVFEAAMTYDRVSGVIEVVSNTREMREEMARIMARELLDHELSGEKVGLKIYDLSRLLRPSDFLTDPQDGIESVRVKLLRLMPLDATRERLTLECLGMSRDIWSMAAQRFGGNNPLCGGWVATQARLIIRFYPKDGGRRGRTVPLTISVPNGCNLREHTEDEQVIGEKYFRRWGILRDL